MMRRLRRRYALAPALWIAALTLLCATTAQAASLRKGPYLVYGDQPTEMAVVWQTDATPSIGATLDWGLSTAYGIGSEVVSESGSGSNEHQFSHTITGLTAGVRYFYRVTVDGVTSEHSFLAAPETSTPSIIFYAFGDTRSNPDYYNVVAQHLLADIDIAADLQQTMVLHSGDWVAEGDIEADWDDQFFDRTLPWPLELMARVPIIGCRGNHERDGALLKKYWPFPYEVGSGGDAYFSFDYGPIHVTVIDQETSFSVGSTQHTWIEQDLANTLAQWKFVVLHKPPYSGGGSHGDHTSSQDRLVPLVESYEVDIVVAGHNHHYARAEVNGIQYITTGGGGAGLTGIDLGKQYVMAAESVRHFTKFTISGSELSFAAIRDDGSLIETLQISKGPDTIPPTLMSATAIGDPTLVRALFSERLEAGNGTHGAENPSNYALAGRSITGVSLDASGAVATLTVSPALVESVTYTLTAQDINDRAPQPNPMAAPQSVDFSYAQAPPEPQDLFVEGDIWHYFKGDTFPGSDWMNPGFDDAAWDQGPTGIGYGDGDDNTVLSDMRDSYLTVYMRRDFDLADPSVVGELHFTVDYDDGFVAFLNGVEVARRNVATGQDNWTEASSHEADAPDNIDLSTNIVDLVAGPNVFAIEAHNTSISSSDLSMIPSLAYLPRPGTTPQDAGSGPPDAAQPDSAQPDAAQPDSAEPDAAQPDSAQPDGSSIDAATADATGADSSGPDASASDAARADAARPDSASATDVGNVDTAAASDASVGTDGASALDDVDAAASDKPQPGSVRLGSGCTCTSAGLGAPILGLALGLLCLRLGRKARR